MSEPGYLGKGGLGDRTSAEKKNKIATKVRAFEEARTGRRGRPSGALERREWAVAELRKAGEEGYPKTALAERIAGQFGISLKHARDELRTLRWHGPVEDLGDVLRHEGRAA